MRVPARGVWAAWLMLFTALLHSAAASAQFADSQPASGAAPASTAAPTRNAAPAAAPTGPTPGTSMPGSAAAPLDAAEDIRDIRGPKFVLPVWVIWALLAGVVLLAASGYAAWRWWVKRRRPRALLPFEAALQRLEEIRPLMQPQLAREFSVAVSDIVRGYIELRFEAIATHQTTEEFLHDLLQSPKALLVRQRTLLSDFLQQCDLVKFAGISLTPKNMESLHQSARAFVQETATADPEPAQAPGSAGAPPAVSGQEAHDSLPST